MSIGIPTKNSGRLKKNVSVKKIATEQEKNEKTKLETFITFLESDGFGKILSLAIGMVFILLIGKFLSMGRPSNNVISVVYYLVALIILIATKVKIANWSRHITWCVIGLSFFLLVSFFCKMEDSRTGVVDGVNPVQKVYNWTVKKINKPPEIKKQKVWETILTKKITGKGMDKKIHLLHHPTEVKKGNKIIVEGKLFKIRKKSGWINFQNRYDFEDIHPNSHTGWHNGFAPNGEILLIKVQKLVQK